MSARAHAISRRRLLAVRLRNDTPGADHWIRVFRRAMACRFEITLSGEDARHLDAARAALDEADRLEAALTVFRDSSELVRVNRLAADAPVEVDHGLFRLLDRCRSLHAETDGAFDITSTPLSRCWGFLARAGRLPSPDAIDMARATVGMSPHVTLDSAARTVRFDRSGVELNLGSIGKGYAVQRIGSQLRARGVRHALVSAASSSILAIGGRGLGWCIDLHSRQQAQPQWLSGAAARPERSVAAPPERSVAAPPQDARFASHAPLVRLFLRNGAIGTSGNGEQFIEIDGTRYGHLLDPRTGWPAAAGLLSASVITHDAATADALATAFFVGGMELAARYCETHPETLALLTPDDGSARPRILGRYSGLHVEDL